MVALPRFALAFVLLVGVLFAVPLGRERAEAVTVSINADYASSAGTFDHERFLNANEGGYRTHNALSWLPESYPTFKQGGMKMVALTHLLNENFYTVVRGTAPNISFDFKRLDRVVLPLVKQGMTPLMGVAFTPQALGGAPANPGMNNAPPNDNALWNKAVRAMVEYYAGLGYTGWYWEVWNEPDLGPFWGGTQAQYNEMYKATADAVRKGDKTAKVGGPTTTQGGWWFFDGFTSYLRANPEVPLDFATFHSYGPDPTFALVDEAKSRLDAAGRTNVPIFITEWNITHIINGGPGAPSDTNVAASYAVRRIADALGRPAVSKLFWFAPKEGYIPSKPFSGDLGLVTVDGHRKAAYNAFQLLSKLHPRLLKSAPAGAGAVGTIATSDPATSKVAVLAWNDQEAETDLALALSNLPYAGKNVRVTQYTVDRTHGNYYQDYSDGLRGWPVGPAESADPVDSRIVTGAAGFNRTVRAAGHSLTLFVLEPTTDAPTDAQQVGPEPIPAGSRNLAHGQPVTASSAVPWGWSTGALTDGLTHTFNRVDFGPDSHGWSSDPHATADAKEWVQVDLGAHLPLNRIRLFPRDDKECEGYGFPIDFTVQGSVTGADWSTLKRVTNHNNGAPLAVPIRPVQYDITGAYRYVRVHATKLQSACAGAAERHFQLAELQVESDSNLATSATTTAAGSTSAEGSGWSTSFVRDGVRSSTGAAHGWSSAGTTTNTAQSLTVSLAATTRLSRVDLVPRDEPGLEGAGFPKSFKVLVAADPGCASWDEVAVRANLSNPGKFTRTIGFASMDARCVRIEATDLYRFPDGQHRFQLAEVELYH